MIPVVERLTIGGLTVLRSDAVAGRYACGLLFRVGRFDETLASSGITHLVEHLTLRQHHKARYSFNAQVTGWSTSFLMDSADSADLGDYIAAVCGGLADDHSEALEQERRVLRTEAASRGGAGALGTCLSERYGATGPGLTAFEEFGLYRLGWPEVEAWRSRWFTAENAVLWISGPVLPGLSIDLPPGQAQETATARPLDVPLPGFVITGTSGVGMSMVARRSPATSAALYILEQRLTQTLRHERGLSYGVRSDEEWIDDEFVHAWIQADALAEQVPAAAGTMLATAGALAEHGGTREEIGDYAQRLRDAYESPGGAILALHRQAHRILSRGPDSALQQPAERIRQFTDLEAQATCDAATGLLENVIVAVPEYVPAVADRMPQLPKWQPAAGTITGTEITSRDRRATLTVGDDGIMLTPAAEGDKHVTIRYCDVAALLRWSDDQRAFVGTDGFSIPLDPGRWPDGGKIAAAIEARVSLDLAVNIGPPRPQTARSLRSAEPPTSAVGRRRIPLRWLRIVWLFCLIVGIRGLISTYYGLGLGFLGIGVVGLVSQEWLIRRWIKLARK
jgi:zinc protease